MFYDAEVTTVTTCISIFVDSGATCFAEVAKEKSRFLDLQIELACLQLGIIALNVESGLRNLDLPVSEFFLLREERWIPILTLESLQSTPRQNRPSLIVIQHRAVSLECKLKGTIRRYKQIHMMTEQKVFPLLSTQFNKFIFRGQLNEPGEHSTNIYMY